MKKKFFGFVVKFGKQARLAVALCCSVVAVALFIHFGVDLSFDWDHVSSLFEVVSRVLDLAGEFKKHAKVLKVASFVTWVLGGLFSVR